MHDGQRAPERGGPGVPPEHVAQQGPAGRFDARLPATGGPVTAGLVITGLLAVRPLGAGPVVARGSCAGGTFAVGRGSRLGCGQGRRGALLRGHG
ncbi:hypothetical protein APASM_3056 [Actinosynnema pretiosum subsp. pretiosum]|nr:hypothetical protein APASM_3056 [Actinosynnema pretiosum subsp. pretiosum]